MNQVRNVNSTCNSILAVLCLALCPVGIAQTAATPDATAQTAPNSQLSVEYANGQLTIHAFRVSISEILDQVKEKTGSSLEFPLSATQAVVAFEMGPAPVHDVLASLLEGSGFDYMIVTADGSDHSLLKISLADRKVLPGNATNVADAMPTQGGLYQQAFTVDENAVPEVAQPEPVAIAEQPGSEKAQRPSLDELQKLQMQLLDQQEEQRLAGASTPQ